MNIYDFTSVNNVAKIGGEIIERYFKNIPATISFTNVEEDYYYQTKDIDFIWDYIHNKKGKMRKFLELKVDRYAYSKNFFFETISNAVKNTPGCFMYTEADYLLYYFVTRDKNQLYIMNMKEVRPWFINNIHRFKEKELKTKVREGTYYNSFGRLVPIETVIKECPSTRVIDMPKELQSLTTSIQSNNTYKNSKNSI